MNRERSLPPLSSGRRLAGKFEIVGVLGEGATGIVYDARRISEGDRVALKVIHQHLAGDAQIRGRIAKVLAGNKDYKNVKAEVEDGIVTLTGDVELHGVRRDLVALRRSRFSSFDRQGE